MTCPSFKRMSRSSPFRSKAETASGLKSSRTMLGRSSLMASTGACATTPVDLSIISAAITDPSLVPLRPSGDGCTGIAARSSGRHKDTQRRGKNQGQHRDAARIPISDEIFLSGCCEPPSPLAFAGHGKKSSFVLFGETHINSIAIALPLWRIVSLPGSGHEGTSRNSSEFPDKTAS